MQPVTPSSIIAAVGHWDHVGCGGDSIRGGGGDGVWGNGEYEIKNIESVRSTAGKATTVESAEARIVGRVSSGFLHPPPLDSLWIQTQGIYPGDDGDVMFIEIVKKNDDTRKEEPEARGLEVEYFDIFPTRSELAYHKYLMYGPIPLIFLRNPIIMEGCPANLKIPFNIGHVHVEKAYIDLNSPLNIMTRMMSNWIMRRKLDPRENLDIGVSNFTGRIKGMHVFVGNFTYVTYS
ncbi:hypothetical protein Tco_1328815 [Tanacetum coccineum]